MFAAALVALITAMAGAFLNSIRKTSVTAFHVALIIEIAVSLADGAYVLISALRHPRAVDAAGLKRMRRMGSGGTGLAILARSGSIAGQLLLVVGCLLFVGPGLALLLLSLRPTLFAEKRAREHLAWQLQVYLRAEQKEHRHRK